MNSTGIYMDRQKRRKDQKSRKLLGNEFLESEAFTRPGYLTNQPTIDSF
jgi:hypothetical protein